MGRNVAASPQRSKSTSTQGMRVAVDACSCSDAIDARYASTSSRSTVAVMVSTSCMYVWALWGCGTYGWQPDSDR